MRRQRSSWSHCSDWRPERTQRSSRPGVMLPVEATAGTRRMRMERAAARSTRSLIVPPVIYLLYFWVWLQWVFFLLLNFLDVTISLFSVFIIFSFFLFLFTFPLGSSLSSFLHFPTLLFLFFSSSVSSFLSSLLTLLDNKSEVYPSVSFLFLDLTLHSVISLVSFHFLSGLQTFLAPSSLPN